MHLKNILCALLVLFYSQLVFSMVDRETNNDEAQTPTYAQLFSAPQYTNGLQAEEEPQQDIADFTPSEQTRLPQHHIVLDNQVYQVAAIDFQTESNKAVTLRTYLSRRLNLDVICGVREDGTGRLLFRGEGNGDKWLVELWLDREKTLTRTRLLLANSFLDQMEYRIRILENDYREPEG